jgi:ATP synthase protein I
MRQNNQRPFQAMALTSAILSQLAGSVLIGIFSGRWLDGRFATKPLFLIIGIFVGLAAGVYAVLTTLRHFNSGD